MKEEVEYVFSFNDEEYNDDVDYILDQIEEAEHIFKEKVETIYVAEKDKRLHKDFLDTEFMLGCCQENAWQDGDEWAEDYLNDVSKDKIKELEKIIVEWLDKNAEQPRFYRVKNIKEIKVEEFKERFC